MSFMHSQFNPKRHTKYIPKNINKYIGKEYPICRSGLEKAFCELLDNNENVIEFNGEYWHSFPNKIEKDKIKEEQCRKNNIDLLVIEEENWINNKEDCLKSL